MALAATAGRADAAALSNGQTKRIDAIARDAMAKQHLVGVEVGVGRRGRLLFSRGYGLRNRTERLPVTAVTIFPIGSITKQPESVARYVSLVDAARRIICITAGSSALAR